MADKIWFEARPFPQEAWHPDYFTRLTEEPVPYLPADWWKKIEIDAPPKDVEAECRHVFDMKRLRPRRRFEIIAEADIAQEVVWPVQLVLGNPFDPVTRSDTQYLVTDTLKAAWTVMFYFKRLFNRGRPWQCCNLPIDPMFQRPDRLYPGHPSYPSGHSVQAHLIALMFGAMFPELRALMLKNADRVAENRVVAGVHYASDSRAGFEIASQLIALFMRNDEILTRMELTRVEWASDDRIRRLPSMSGPPVSPLNT